MKLIRASQAITVSCGLIALVSAFAWYCYRGDYVLYYGDAVSHLNASRSLIDSRTPGYDQLGTPWLPMLHLICLPFVGNDFLWSTGLAGTIPVAVCFAIAGSCFYLAARELYRDAIAAWVVIACFALNPNLLYLASIPMTEIVFLAGLSVLVLAALRFEASQRYRWLALAIAASWFMSLTRYDGWFLIPFLSIWLARVASSRRLAVFLIVASVASIAPLYWLAHNWWETRNPLDFYNGPYSAAAIQGAAWYPGYHDWIAAARYYFEACRLCAGTPLLLLAAGGVWCARKTRAGQALAFLSLAPLFYIWSVHSSKLPIHVPGLWPLTYYNTRYGIAILPLCAFAAGAVSLKLSGRARKLAFALPLFATAPWLIHPTPTHWICWKESQVNSVDRRAWTNAAAQFLTKNYRAGEGILSSNGDVGGIYMRARIHLSETINIGNGPLWMAATARPELYHPCAWAIAQQKDVLARALASKKDQPYRPRLIVTTSKFSPPLGLARRDLSRP